MRNDEDLLFGHAYAPDQYVYFTEVFGKEVHLDVAEHRQKLSKAFFCFVLLVQVAFIPNLMWIYVHTVWEMCCADIFFAIWSTRSQMSLICLFFLALVTDAHNVASRCAIQVNNPLGRLPLPLFHPTFVLSLLTLAFSITCWVLWSGYAGLKMFLDLAASKHNPLR